MKEIKKYNVYGIVSASVHIGTYEAESKEQAEDMANNDKEANWYPSLCHQCSGELEIGDIYELQVEGTA